jgi:hypothetical protein
LTLLKTANSAPFGSLTMAKRPTSGTSVAAFTTLPLFCSMAATAASTSGTDTNGSQWLFTFLSSAWRMLATSLPPAFASSYFMPAVSCGSTVQPSRSAWNAFDFAGSELTSSNQTSLPCR